MEPKVIIYIDDSNDKIAQVTALLDLMDENNGIYLDRVLMDNAFYDYFEVRGLGLYGITRRVKEGISFEMASFQLASVNHTRYQGNEFDVDSVGSYKVTNTQKALLRPID